MNRPSIPATLAEAVQQAGDVPSDGETRRSGEAYLATPRARSTVGETRRPLPYPDGWFLAGFSEDIKPGQIRTVAFMGQELVLYRTHTGLARAIDPYCPHLGAHLGHGGKVDGENLVCPLHGLAYAPDGVCVRTGHGGKPPRASLTARYMKEVNGAIMVWVDHAGGPPVWDVPEQDLSEASAVFSFRKELNGQTLDGMENGVDVEHFGWLHGLTNPSISHRIEGQVFHTSLSAHWKGLRFSGEFTNYGVGYVFGLFAVPDLGVTLLARAYVTQVAPLRWHFATADRLRIERVSRWPPVARNMLYATLVPFASRWLKWFVGQDFPIWNAKSFVREPKLTAMDKMVIVHRRWASQFYPGGLMDGHGATSRSSPMSD